MSDNGAEFKGKLKNEHHFETFCKEVGVQHIYTLPYRPQTNGKIEAFWKILNREFYSPNSFTSEEDLKINFGKFLFEYNHLRRHGA